MNKKIAELAARRPLFLCCSSFSGAVILGFLLIQRRAAGYILTAALAAVFLAAAAFSVPLAVKERRPVYAAVALAALFALAGSTVPQAVRRSAEKRLDGLGGTHSAVCRVTEITSRYPYFSSAVVRVTEVDGKKASFSARLTTDTELDTGVGGMLTLRNAVFSALPENENGFPTARYYAGRGVFCDAKCEYHVSGEYSPSFADRISSFAGRLSARLSVMCGKDEGGLAAALFLGRRNELPQSVSRDFSRLGISHLLAVSGLHLSLLAMFAEHIFRRIFRKRYTPMFACFAVIAVYSALTGFHYSVTRAAVMLLLSLTARYTGRQADTLTSLSAAAFLILVFSPYAALDAGFLLSFISVLGIVTVGAPVAGYLKSKTGSRLLSAAASALAVTGSSLFFTLPVTWYVYGSLSAVSPLANLMFLPLSAAILILTPVALVLPPAAVPLRAVCRAVISLSGAASVTAPDPVYTGYSFTPFCWLFAVTVLFLCLAAIKRSWRPRVALSALCSVVALAASFSVCAVSEAKKSPDISAVNFGTNDHVIACDGGTVVMTDVSTGSFTAMRNAASLGLDDLRKTNVDVLILTHLHTLHVSSFDRFSDTYLLSCVMVPDGGDPAVSERIADIARKKGIEFRVYGEETVSAGSLSFTFFSPLPQKNRTHDALLFGLGKDGRTAYFAYPSYMAALPDLPEDAAVFLLSHGNTLPSGSPPDGCIAMNRETAELAGAGEYIGQGDAPASCAFRLEGSLYGASKRS